MSVVLCFLATFLIAYFITSTYKLLLVGSRIPGPIAFPLVGNIQWAIKMKPEFVFVIFTKLREQYRQTYRLWLGPQLWVFLHTPAETRDALNDATLVKAETFNQLNVLIGNGLLISHGRYWETHRRALGPAFHPNILKSFTPTLTQHAQRLVEKLSELNGESIEATDYLFPCILDAIVETSMGKQLKSQDNAGSIYTHAFHKTGELLFKRMINPLLIPDFIFKRTQIWQELEGNLKVIHTLMESVIEDRAAFLKEQCINVNETPAEDFVLGKKRRTLLDTLLTTQIDGQPLSAKEIRDEVNTFVFAGVDTTTAAMSFVLYALGRYPSEQAKVYAELQNAQLDLEQLDANQLNQLEYLDMFIKECMRFYTIVPATGRQTTTTTKIGDRTYCAGITLWINMYGLAHDSDYFPEPYEFQPERFTKEQQAKLPAFAYLPFAGGPHVCIGKKYSLLIMKILIVKILENFVVTLRDPEAELVLKAQMVLKAVGGINLVFKPRRDE